MCRIQVSAEWSFLPLSECSIVVIVSLTGRLIDRPCRRILENKVGVFLECLHRHTLQLFISSVTIFVGHFAPIWKIVRSIEWIPGSQLCLALLAMVLVWNQVWQFLSAWISSCPTSWTLLVGGKLMGFFLQKGVCRSKGFWSASFESTYWVKGSF